MASGETNKMLTYSALGLMLRERLQVRSAKPGTLGKAEMEAGACVRQPDWPEKRRDRAVDQ